MICLLCRITVKIQFNRILYYFKTCHVWLLEAEGEVDANKLLDSYVYENNFNCERYC